MCYNLHKMLAFKRLLKLAGHENPHVRRWCSEGVRPRLPWGKKLIALVRQPSPIVPILEALKDDPEIYVRRSVANNVNDIAKDHPQVALHLCEAWSKGNDPSRDWIVKHGLRTLIKAGDPGALKLVGFATPKKLTAELSIRPKQIAVGGSVDLEDKLTSAAARTQQLLVDYVVHYVRRSGKTFAKVFKWTTVDLPAKDSITLTKRHPMKPTTVRALSAGTYRVELQISGLRCAESSFRLA